MGWFTGGVRVRSMTGSGCGLSTGIVILEPRCHSRTQRDLEDDLRNFFSELAPLHVDLRKHENFISRTYLSSPTEAEKVFCHIIETAISMCHDNPAGIG